MSIIWTLLNPFPGKTNLANTASYVDGAGNTKILETQTLISESWSAVGIYYQYDYTHVDISSKSLINLTPHSESILTYISASIQPFISSSVGTASLYSINPPNDDIITDIIIVASA